MRDVVMHFASSGDDKLIASPAVNIYLMVPLPGPVAVRGSVRKMKRGRRRENIIVALHSMALTPPAFRNKPIAYIGNMRVFLISLSSSATVSFAFVILFYNSWYYVLAAAFIAARRRS